MTSSPRPPSDPSAATYAGFNGNTLVARGGLAEVGLALRRVAAADGRPLIFDNRTGRVVDLNLHGSDDAVRQRAQALSPGDPPPPPPSPAPDTAAEPRGRGRPKLGVVAREVTLLPRHWEWLAAQPGGASVALRKLVEAARRVPDARAARRQAQKRAYTFMAAIAGDLPGFEEASRALFADDLPRLDTLIAAWPHDVRAHVLWLAADPPPAPS